MPTVYILHFSRLFRHSLHYIGYTMRPDVFQRIEEQKTAKGTRVTREAFAAGVRWTIGFTCSRWTREEIRRIERTIRRTKARLYCRVCNRRNSTPKA